MNKTVKEDLRGCGNRRVREMSDNHKGFNPTDQENGAATGRSGKVKRRHHNYYAMWYGLQIC